MPTIAAAASTVRMSALETRDRKFIVEIKDNGLRAERLDSRTYRLHGSQVADDFRGGQRSNFLLLTGDGSVGVQMPLHRGMSAEDVLKAAEARLQPGFSIQRLPSPEGVIDFRIVETLNDPELVHANLARAAEADSFGGEKLTYSELRFAYRQARKDGFSDAEQAAFSERYATFAEAGQVTAAARFYFGLLQKKFDL